MKKRESTHVSTTPITPSTLAKMFQLKYPDFPLIVRGEVTGLRPYPAHNPTTYYGDLSDDEFTMEFRVPPSEKLKARGQFVEIVGAIKANPNKTAKTVVPLLVGEVVGEYQPTQRASFVLDDKIQMDAKISLKAFLKQHTKMSLAFLATQNGYNDFLQSCHDAHKIDNLIRLDCNFMGKESVIASIQQVKSAHIIKGIVILRGGRTSNDDLRLWNDIDVLQALYGLNMPFYTAIGHASDILLVDKHAHESFTTPTMFGHKFREALNEIYWDQERDSTIKDLQHALLKQGPTIKQQRQLMMIGGLTFFFLLAMEVKFSLIDKFIQFLSRA